MSKRPSKPAPPVERVSEPSTDLLALPPRVQTMRAKVLEAAQTRDVENLRAPIEWNETPPLFARGAERPKNFGETIEFLKKRSFDAEGLEICDILAAIFAQPYVKTTRKPVVTYVWPAFALRPPPTPSREDLVAMYSCVRFANLGASNDGLPLIERIGIGEDGTWHFFWTG